MDARLYYTTKPTGAEPIEELSIVRLIKGVHVAPIGYLPEGTLGTVVAVYGKGESCEIEFEAPFHAVLTLSENDFRSISELTRERIIASSKFISDRRS